MEKERAIKQFLEIRKYGKKMRLAAEQWDKDWKTLIAVMLSARTRDEVTIKVCENLFNKFKKIEDLANAKFEEVSKIIKPVNFYKNKTKNVIACAKEIVKNYNGKVPRDLKLLIRLPGVGRKTANVFLAEYDEDAIGVDTHVFYCSRKLGWAKSKNPHKVEEELKKLFPKKYWGKINLYLVRFGKTFTSKKEKDAVLEKISKIK